MGIDKIVYDGKVYTKVKNKMIKYNDNYYTLNRDEIRMNKMVKGSPVIYIKNTEKVIKI